MLSFLQVFHAKNSITLKWIQKIKQFKNVKYLLILC